jgi:Zn-dependent protease
MQTIRKNVSFHDISPREYMYFPKGVLEMGKPGAFSKVELKHIVVSMIILIVCFTFTLSLNSVLWSFLYNFSIHRFQVGIQLSIVAVFTAFLFHEISHKIIAQHYRLWSEFRFNLKALFISFILSILTGFVFAAPGSVLFRGEPRVFEEGHVAMAGPLANILIANIFTPVYIHFFAEIPGFIPRMIGFICIINCIFAFFNLLPFKSFDGEKVIHWNKKVWIFMITYSFILLLFISPFSIRIFPVI